MIRVLLGLIFISVTSQVICQQDFDAVAKGRHRRPISYAESSVPVSGRPQGLNPAVIDSIFQIPIAVIQGTSAAAQSWYPDNSDTIDKFFDIPVQTLQAVGNLVKNRIPQDQRYQQRQRIQRRELQRGKRFQDQEHSDGTRRVKRQQQTEQDQQPEAARTLHSFYDPFAWADALADLLVGHGGIFGGPGGFFGRPGHHGGHRKKKRKKRPHGVQQHIFGGHFTHSHQHFQGIHGSHLGSHLGLGHGPFGGAHQILGGDDSLYEVTEIIDDIKPQGFFSFLQPSQEHDIIQNKIAPKYDDLARLAFPTG